MESTAARPEKGRVLLLEDDASFREIITDYLTDDGYSVVAVENGGEGVREVLSSDFSLVVCDLMMPTLPGDMFYRAVQSMRPALAQRFIFMTGYRNDVRTNTFVKDINAFVLRKPFPLKSLLDAIALAEVRSSYRSICHPAPDAPTAGQPPEVLPMSAGAPAPGRIIPYPARKSAVVPVRDKARRAAGGLRALGFAGLTALVLPLGLLLWYGVEQNRAARWSAEQQTLEAQWATISPHFESVKDARSKAALAQQQRTLILEDRAKLRWTAALAGIAMAATKDIEIREIQGRAEAKDSGACRVRIHGMASGSKPRLAADRFRVAMQENMLKNAKGRPVSTRFDRLDDEPGVLPNQLRAAFVVTATYGSMESPAAPGKEGR